MCEILLKRGNNGQAPPWWQDLDVIAVNPDGWLWGSNEQPRNNEFYLIKIPGVTVQAALAVFEDLAAVYGPPTPDGRKGELLFRRKRFIRQESIPPGQVVQLQNDGELTLPNLTVLQAWLRTRP